MPDTENGWNQKGAMINEEMGMPFDGSDVLPDLHGKFGKRMSCSRKKWKL